MKHLSLPFFLMVAILAMTGCNMDPSSKEVETTNGSSSTKTYRVAHTFSDLNTEDVFEASLRGTKPDNMILLFTIKKADGSVLFQEKIKGTDLLGSTDPNVDLRKEPDQIAFIQNIAKEFLGEEQFLVPAVLPDQEADDYAPDKAFYEELKRTRLNGFTYRLGKEDNRYIAWSDKDKKVKIYYNCC